PHGGGGDDGVGIALTLNLSWPNPTTAVLTWNDPYTTETGYKLSRKLDYSVDCSTPWTAYSWTEIGSWGPAPGPPTFTDTGLRPDSLYCYTISASFPGGATPGKATICAMSPSAGKSAGPVLTSPAQTGSSITLAFQDRMTKESEYILERRYYGWLGEE